LSSGSRPSSEERHRSAGLHKLLSRCPAQPLPHPHRERRARQRRRQREPFFFAPLHAEQHALTFRRGRTLARPAATLRQPGPPGEDRLPVLRAEPETKSPAVRALAARLLGEMGPAAEANWRAKGRDSRRTAWARPRKTMRAFARPRLPTGQGTGASER